MELYVRFVLLCLCISSLLSNEKFYPFSKEKREEKKWTDEARGSNVRTVLHCITKWPTHIK